MASSFLGLYVQRDAINLAQKGLDITGHNISNINTPGYSRQRLDLCSVANTKGTLGYITGVKLAGKGSEATGVAQYRDALLDAHVRRYSGELCDIGAKTNVLADIEDVLDDYENEKSGMATLFGNWKAAIQSMSSTSADRQDLANICKNSAQTVINVLKNFDVRLSEIETGVEKDIQNTNTRINAILSQMGDLNKQIESAYVQMEDVYETPYGETSYKADVDYGPLELKDKFHVLCDELSQYMNITVTEQPMGSFKVEMGDKVLVYKDEYAKTDIRFIDEEGKDKGTEYRFAEIYVSSLNNKKEWIKCQREILPGYSDESIQVTKIGQDGKPVKDENGNDVMITVKEAVEELNILINKGEVYHAYEYEKEIMNKAGEDYIPIFKKNLEVYRNTYDSDIKDPSYAIEISEETKTVKSGSMKGLFDMFNGEGKYGGVNCEHKQPGEFGGEDLTNSSYQGIKYYQETLRAFAKAIVNDFNKMYEDNGYGDFKMFDFTDGELTIGSMKIADTWKEDPLRFVHPQATQNDDGTTDGYYYDELDNDFMNKVLSVFDASHKFGVEPNFYTFEEFIAFYGNTLGGQLEGELNSFDTANISYESAEDAREELMGVQMDEEAVNMMNYQKWYNAISRMINALDECLDKLINQTGRVGL